MPEYIAFWHWIIAATAIATLAARFAKPNRQRYALWTATTFTAAAVATAHIFYNFITAMELAGSLVAMPLTLTTMMTAVIALHKAWNDNPHRVLAKHSNSAVADALVAAAATGQFIVVMVAAMVATHAVLS